MNVTREVVTDLLPIYFSGEASGDTKVLVEDYFVRIPTSNALRAVRRRCSKLCGPPRPSRPAQKKRNATWRASFGDCGGASGCSA